jgi:hypothetical protein
MDKIEDAIITAGMEDDGFLIMGRAFELEGDRLLLRAADKTQEAAPALAHQLSASTAYGAGAAKGACLFKAALASEVLNIVDTTARINTLLGRRDLEATLEARALAERIADVALRKRATELLSQRAATGQHRRAWADEARALKPADFLSPLAHTKDRIQEALAKKCRLPHQRVPV